MFRKLYQKPKKKKVKDESESEVEMDEFDEQYIDMEEEELEDEDIEFTYFQNLEKDVKQKHLNSLKEIKEDDRIFTHWYGEEFGKPIGTIPSAL